MRRRATRGGLELTESGLGTAQLGNLFSAIDDQQAEAVVAAAWQRGIRYFDTAPHYGLGLSERRLGRALRAYPRDEFVISTKAGRLLEANPDPDPGIDSEGFAVPADTRRVWDFSRDGILRSIESSLERTGLDRLDIVYLHDPDDHWSSASTTGIDTLIELREQGVLRAVGAGMNQSAMPAELIRVADVDLIMLAGRFTLLDQSGLDELLPLALERGVGIVAAGVYNSGLLGRDRPRTDAHYDYQEAPRALIERATLIAEVCERFGCTLPEAAIAFALSHPAVVSVVLGARSAEQLTENVRRAGASVPTELWPALRDAGLIDSPTTFTGAS
ncbi:aldo/keto reductase [Microbacteriaceae bacterium VKM Ac-2855]|nr:aldo/keto reductase [Microbacteriaceae bacterium VKM Ac-2855]